MIEVELITDGQYLLWMMDDWTTDELNRAITRHRERRGFAPERMVYNPKDNQKANKLQTGLLFVENERVPQGYINLS